MTSNDVLSIVHLPIEVLEQIVTVSAVSSQLSLALVSRLFNFLALRALYYDITLTSPAAVIRCCRTLTSNKDALAVVRFFEINYSYYSSNTLLTAYYLLIKKTLLALRELHTLRLLVHDPHFVTLIRHCQFLGLRQLECYLTPSPQLIDFLNRHPTISYMQLSPHEDMSMPLFALDENGNYTYDIPLVDLPSLKYFVGNVQGLPYLGPSTRLRAAIINWNAVDTNPDLAFRALQRSSRNSLALLSCVRRGWNLDAIQSISQWLPDIHFLHISNIMLVDTFPAEEYLQSVQTYLVHFTHLKRLHINCVDYWETANLTSSVDEDYSTVVAWGGACPSLREISLPHSQGLSWFRISDSSWIPDPSHATGEQWIQDAVASKTHPNWRRIIHDLKKTESSAADDFADQSAFTSAVTVARRLLSNLLQEPEEATITELIQAPSMTAHGDDDISNLREDNERSFSLLSLV